MTVSALVEGRVRSIATYGPVEDALEEAISRLERLGKVEILSISTPETIYRDLQGDRVQLAFGHWATMAPPETVLLRRIGRTDLTPEPRSEAAARNRLSHIRAEEKRLRKTGTRKAVPQPRFAEWYDKLGSVRAVARKTKRSRTAVRNYLIRAGRIEP